MITRRRLLARSAAILAMAAGRPFRARALVFEQFEVTHTDAEWRKLLTPNQYQVLRHEATERPFTSALLHEKRRGSFACAGCALENFSSATKFDSGTGWPSFWAPDRESRHHQERQLVRRDPDRCGVPALRRPPRSRLRRWAEADGAAVLHQRCRVDIQAASGVRLYSATGARPARSIRVGLNPACNGVQDSAATLAFMATSAS